MTASHERGKAAESETEHDSAAEFKQVHGVGKYACDLLRSRNGSKQDDESNQ
jgi:hypothetical protein